jgi:uncharacterized OB-fold protein
MGSKHIKRRLLTYEKPWIRQNPKPPKARTLIGESFSAANYQGVLKLQHCDECQTVNYPPRELCHSCLSEKMVWRATPNDGVILSTSELHHSQWEFFKRKIKDAPWPIATVQVAGQCMFVHLAVSTFAEAFEGLGNSPSLAQALPKGTPVKVFTQSDTALRSVLIAVSADTPVEQVSQRVAIMEKVGLR